MSKQQIPINDLLQYLDEQEENNTISCGWTIIDYIYGHYNLLSKRNIHTPTAWIFSNWCFGNHGTISEYTIFMPGMLVRKPGLFGVIHEGKNLHKREQTSNLWVYYTDTKFGTILDVPFYAPEWEQWGTMSQIYDYSIYKPQKNFYMLGKRKLSIGDRGLDVLILQIALLNFGEQVKVNGDYDFATKTAIENIQKCFSLPVNGIVDVDDNLLSYLHKE